MYTENDIQQARTLFGVVQDASLSDIKKIYRKLALSSHPDKNRSHEATQKMQEINQAYEMLIETENGKNLYHTPEHRAATKEELSSFFKFYGWFTSPRQPSASDFISEDDFQAILQHITNWMKEHAGFVYPGHEKLFGLDIVQVKRLLVHCAQAGAWRFHFDDCGLRAEVVTALLYFLAEYEVPTIAVHELELSGSFINHPEVVAALCHFVTQSQTTWKLKLEKCNLKLTDELAEAFANSKTVLSLSLQNNGTNMGLMERVTSQNDFMDSLDIRGNMFGFRSQYERLLDGVAKNPILRRFAFNLVDVFAWRAMNLVLHNQQNLEEITIRGATLTEIEGPEELRVYNTRLRTLRFEYSNVDEKVISSLFRALPKHPN